MPARAELLADVRARLEANQRVRRSLRPEGRLHVDRQLPFLVVHRRPTEVEDDGAARLVTPMASYLAASAQRRGHRNLARLVRTVVDTQLDAFGSFLLLEIWTVPDPGPGPSFRVRVPRSMVDDPAVRELESRLGRVRVRRVRAAVTVEPSARTAPPGLPSWMPNRDALKRNVLVLGLEVGAIWREPEGDQQFPMVLAALARQVSRALHRCFFEFARTHTTHRPPHYHALGRRALVQAAWKVDGELAGVANTFDLLMLCTPTNTEKAWNRFRRKNFAELPSFRYRSLPLDPVLLKRRLYSIPIERVEDPQLERILRQRQLELDRQLTLLIDRGTRTFRDSSAALYGAVDDELLKTARKLLKRCPVSEPGEYSKRDVLRAEAFADLAREELRAYRRQDKRVRTHVDIRDDIPAGLMVSRGRLLVGSGSRIPANRAEALLAHEVGTHVVTYYNGQAQPLQLLASGLAGYEELQEGVAVLAEYLVGGLTGGRLRLLAARVLAAHSIGDGADFVETHRLLTGTCELEPRSAFNVAMRVHRGGGLTKDAIYLRGLQGLLDYLADGGDFDVLLVGKIALEHVGVVEELLHRKVLHPPPLRPRYLDRPEAAVRLGMLRNGLDLGDLVP